MAARRRDTSEKRASILDAATRVFTAEGYESASMDRIAEVAGASKRTVYNHFPSKQVLFTEVVERFLAESGELKQVPYDPELDLEPQLGRFADAMIAIAQNPSWLGITKVMTSVVIGNPALIGEVMARVNGEEDKLATWVAHAAADGRLVTVDPALAAKTFWAMLGGAFLFPAIYAGPMDPAAIAVMKPELIATFLARYAA